MNKLIFIFCLLILNSCKEKTNQVAVVTSFTTINSSSTITRDIQKLCFDKLAQAINTLKYDKSAKINTNELLDFLNKADSANNVRITIISRVEEFDNEIGLKKKANAYAIVLQSIYSNEFKACIWLLSDTGTQRYSEAVKILKTMLEKMSEPANAYNDAINNTVLKYKIHILDTLPNRVSN